MTRRFPHRLPPDLRRRLMTALTASAVAASPGAAGEAPPQPRPQAKPEASGTLGGAQTPGTVADGRAPPPLECYRAARSTLAVPAAEPLPATEEGRTAGSFPGRETVTVTGPGGSANGDAYVCDLAVQIARDSGSSRALAAALTNRALVLGADGRLEPALADLDAAVQLTPEDPAVHGNRGNLLLRLGRPGEALAAHNRAVDLDPEDPGTYYNRAFSYRAVGDPERAEQDVAAARSLLQRRQLPLRRPRTREPADR